MLAELFLRYNQVVPSPGRMVQKVWWTTQVSHGYAREGPECLSAAKLLGG